jgi:uncharacterized membrane protein
MASIEKSIEVDVPVRTAYNQWTQFESFPRFMEGVEEVRQVDDKRLHWRAEIGGKTEEWDAEIVEQVPDTRIAWRSISGATNAGRVNFDHVNPTRTRVNLHLEYEPQGAMESIGDALGFVSRRAENDLEKFKEFVEQHGAEGGWRGEIHGDDVDKDSGTGTGGARI